ncbi:MAG: tripartite tricarboxylate transporter substrate binding protein [Burkholderiaceae bacterium]
MNGSLTARKLPLALLAKFTIGMLPMVSMAQDNYPSRPIKIFVGVAPGGLIDATARLAATNLASKLGQPIIVENRPGANTTIAANAVLKAAPDGYTFFYGGAMSASPIFVKNGAVDFVKQMKPVSLLVSAPFFMLVNNKVPAKTVQELIDYSKKNPGKLNFADGAPASTLVMHAIAERTGITFTPIPYKGSAPSLMAVIADEVDMTIDTVPNYLPHIKSGKVRAVMNTGQARGSVLPDVPTGTEAKVIDFNAASVLGLWAPPGTPDAIVQRVSKEIAGITKTPDFREKFRVTTQTDPVGSTPAELLRTIEADNALFIGVAKRIGFQPQ